MADLPNRQQHEDRVAAAIAEVLRKHRAEWQQGIDAPETERELSDRLKSLLLVLFLAGSGAAAGELGIATNARGAGGAWAGTYSNALARALLGGISRRIQNLRGANASPEQMAELVDKLQTATRWAGVGATETTRANTAGGEFAAAAFNSEAGFSQRQLPLGGHGGTPVGRGQRMAIAIWRTSRIYSDRVCPICRPWDGKERREWVLAFPLGPPSPHPICRCWIDYYSSWDDVPDYAPAIN